MTRAFSGTSYTLTAPYLSLKALGSTERCKRPYCGGPVSQLPVYCTVSVVQFDIWHTTTLSVTIRHCQLRVEVQRCTHASAAAVVMLSFLLALAARCQFVSHLLGFCVPELLVHLVSTNSHYLRSLVIHSHSFMCIHNVAHLHLFTFARPCIQDEVVVFAGTEYGQ